MSTTPDSLPIEQQVGQLLAAAIRSGASDVHLRAEQPPMFRVAGDLQAVNMPAFDRAAMRAIANRMTPAGLREAANTANQIDFSAEWQATARFRVHRFQVRGEPALVLRIIPLTIPDFASLRLPVAVKRIANLERGLVLITGPTGMGKSTTIASILDFIAHNHSKHILSIEDPLEFIIGPGLSVVSQRELGRDVTNYALGLWAALREDPDVIFIGEIRNLETVRVALQAAETGHLVISAIHTLDATSTIEHVVNMFPSDEQASARIRLAETLQAVLCQRLVTMKGRRQLVLACEVMLRGPSIYEWIRRPEKVKPLVDLIAAATPDGMLSFDQSLRRLYEAGLVELEVASAAASSPSDFIRNLKLT